MKRLSCKWIRNSLSAYLDGEADKPLIEKHLEECPSCQEFLSELKKVRQTLNSLTQSTSSPEPPPFMAEKITNRLPKYDFGILTDKVMRRAAVATAMVLLLIVGGLRIFPVREVSPSFALVTQIQGEAERYAKDNQWQPLKLSSALYPEDIFRTKAGSNLKLRLQDGSALFVKEDSSLKIENLTPEVEFNLSRGKLLVFVAKPSLFLIRTPAVEIEVCGTLFKILADEERTEVEVLEGAVKLSKDGIILEPFEKAVVSLETFSRKEMSSEEIENSTNEFKEAELLEEKKPFEGEKSIIFWREIK